MKRDGMYRFITIAAPIAAFLLVTGGSVYEWMHMKRLEGESMVTEGKLNQIDQELRSFESQPQTERFPTVPKSSREQGQFLDALRANADTCKVQLVRWSNSTPAPGAAGSGTSNAPAPAAGDKTVALPTGVSAIVSIVEVTGRADSLRQFLYNVVRSRRLLNMTDIKWVRDKWPDTHLTCTLTRYVAPAVELPAGHGRPDHPGADAHAAPAPGSGPTLMPAGAPGHPAGPGGSGAVTLPNPMDAPGIAHGAYQENLESNYSQLNEISQPQSSGSPRPPTVTNTKR